MMIKKRKIRAHHLLCLHGFKGIGYSPEFVEEMTEYVQEMRNPNQPVQLTVIIGQDELCQNCPHDGGEVCLSADRLVRQIDQKTVEKLRLTPNQTYQKEELLHQTAKNIQPEDLEYICRGCQWLEMGVCKEGIKQLKNGVHTFFIKK